MKLPKILTQYCPKNTKSPNIYAIAQTFARNLDTLHQPGGKKTVLKNLLETLIRKNLSIQKEKKRTQEKSGCAMKIVMFSFMFSTNNNVETETGFLRLKKFAKKA